MSAALHCPDVTGTPPAGQHSFARRSCSSFAVRCSFEFFSSSVSEPPMQSINCWGRHLVVLTAVTTAGHRACKSALPFSQLLFPPSLPAAGGRRPAAGSVRRQRGGVHLVRPWPRHRGGCGAGTPLPALLWRSPPRWETFAASSLLFARAYCGSWCGFKAGHVQEQPLCVSRSVWPAEQGESN